MSDKHIVINFCKLGNRFLCGCPLTEPQSEWKIGDLQTATAFKSSM